MKDFLRIREASVSDSSAITEVHFAAWKTGYRDIFSADALSKLDFDDRKRRWEEVLKDPDSTTLLAESGGEILGFIHFGWNREGEVPPEMRPIGEIMAIYVMPIWWGQGVGYRLTVIALDQLKKMGMTGIVLWVLAENVRAISFYERVGFAFSKVTTEREVLGRRVLVRQYFLLP